MIKQFSYPRFSNGLVFEFEYSDKYLTKLKILMLGYDLGYSLRKIWENSDEFFVKISRESFREIIVPVGNWTHFWCLLNKHPTSLLYFGSLTYVLWKLQICLPIGQKNLWRYLLQKFYRKRNFANYWENFNIFA